MKRIATCTDGPPGSEMCGFRRDKRCMVRRKSLLIETEDLKPSLGRI